MCGFAGIVAPAGEVAPVALAERMASTLHHRGPDDAGRHGGGSVAFGFRRLSILDLSPAGHQPFQSPDGQVTLVFNGEIYNYRELRESLTARGHRFRSTGDTEVLLTAYLEWGTGCFERLNGMWALLIHDARTGTVIGSRDRFGVKPLFHVAEGGYHYFASEIKALHLAVPASREVDQQRLARLLAAGNLESFPDDGATFFRRVRQVEPGSFFELDGGGTLRTSRFWTLPQEEEIPEPDPVATFRDLFLDAVALRLRSDVPVGVSLSGGMDSTAIISAMARLRGRQDAGTPGPLHAFTYHSPGHDESRFVASTLQLTGATAHPVACSPRQCWDTLPTVLAFHDEPIHSATASVSFEIYRAARAAGVTVMLVGQGADETLGGYPSYFSDYWDTLLRERSWRRFLEELDDYSAGHGGHRGLLVARAMLRSLLVIAGRLAVYRRFRAGARRTRAYPYAGLLAPELRRTLPREVADPPSGLRAALVHGTTRTPLPLYLRLEDRNSMAHSVEARLPFLDYRLVSLAFRLGNAWKIRGRWNKILLREASTGLVPDAVRWRVDKMGFPTRMSDWLRGELRGDLEALFSDPGFGQGGLVAPAAARQLLADHASGRCQAGGALFHLAQAEFWLRGLAAGPRIPEADAPPRIGGSLPPNATSTHV